MKFLLPALLLLTVPAPTLAQPTPAMAQPDKPVCIHASEVRSSHPTDDERAILFTMRNGDVWRNDLRGRCLGLRFEGFVWTLTGTDRVCSNQQTLQTVQSHSICALGKFTLQPKKP